MSSPLASFDSWMSCGHFQSHCCPPACTPLEPLAPCCPQPSLPSPASAAAALSQTQGWRPAGGPSTGRWLWWCQHLISMPWMQAWKRSPLPAQSSEASNAQLTSEDPCPGGAGQQRASALVRSRAENNLLIRPFFHPEIKLGAFAGKGGSASVPSPWQGRHGGSGACARCASPHPPVLGCLLGNKEAGVSRWSPRYLVPCHQFFIKALVGSVQLSAPSIMHGSALGSAGLGSCFPCLLLGAAAASHGSDNTCGGWKTIPSV